jgi:hypothetical protein
VRCPTRQMQVDVSRVVSPAGSLTSIRDPKPRLLVDIAGADHFHAPLVSYALLVAKGCFLPCGLGSCRCGNSRSKAMPASPLRPRAGEVDMLPPAGARALKKGARQGEASMVPVV